MILHSIKKKAYNLLKKAGMNVSLGFFSFNFFYRVLRPSLTDVMKANLKQGQVFVDIGANIGYYAVVASRLVGRSGIVFAFEPDPLNFRRLLHNLRLNNCANVRALQMAVSDHKGKIRLFISKDDASEHSTYPVSGRSSITVDGTDLDSYLVRSSVDFVKIDVEGYEPAVFKGMRRILKNPKIKVITEFYPEGLRNAGFSPKQYLESYYRLGFKFHLIKERKHVANQISIAQAIRLCKSGPKAINLFLTR
jgi:FkbM family methyltransferase